MSSFRVGIFWMNGSPLHVDIYDGPQYVAHCETPEQAQRIVGLLEQGELDKQYLDDVSKALRPRKPGERWTYQPDQLVGMVRGLLQERDALRAAIFKHRDQKGDNRCWLDDRELYATLGEPQDDVSLPPREEFLSNCERYWRSRQVPGAKYVAQSELESLRKERDALQSALTMMRMLFTQAEIKDRVEVYNAYTPQAPQTNPEVSKAPAGSKAKEQNEYVSPFPEFEPAKEPR